jgi:hypothetical protein
MSTVAVTFKGLDALEALFARAPALAQQAATLAVNDTSKFAFRESSKEIRSQASFSREYLGSAETRGSDRLRILPATRGGTVEARLVARNRPTSLARFVQGTPSKGKPVRVRVSPRGGVRSIGKAFIVRLRAGKTVTEDNFNEGLALRLSPGQAVKQRKKGKAGLPEIFPNVFLLYGPSVAQVFNTVSRDIEGRVGNKLESEFTRQFQRLFAKGGR